MARANWIVVASGSERGRVVPIHRHLLVGRECVGVAPAERLILDDPSVSRDHFDLRIDREGVATLTDISTNGTRVNDLPATRNQPIRLHDGDAIAVGATRLQFRSAETSHADDQALRATLDGLGDGRLTIAATNPLRDLTVREREILALIARGHSNAAIAERLVLSTRTVEGHVANIMDKLRLPDSDDVNRRVQAVLTYLRAVTGSAHAE